MSYPNDADQTALPASERAFLHVKQAVIRGDFASGTMISEGLVAQELDISRTPVHEAFLRLAAEGLLDLLSRKGAIVRPMSPSEAEDVLEMREAIESAAAERVIRLGDADTVLPLLRELLSVQADATGRGDVEGYLDADDRFHSAVVEASGNRIAVDVMSRLRDRQQRLRHQLVRVRPAQIAEGLVEHRQLAEALAAGDAAAYATVLHAHVASHRGAL
ncbi:GntR family transcriptional regulator [Gordonia soli]|uniref:Putative GntR family transcriptional regulator n=1 Tax=Gordonia soli NBRC 108243 TaxID=1223545 RepID=M0QF80_9ACTN|nr:GntR family transcriptional regulator [Gordonia soli]GAC67238.1 putative GntR family transcriptional regulator [Gordonia soli NBRC 108243]